MDSPEKENAVKCLRLNMNGLAGSTSGWKGPYNVAITVDGQIIADRITSGILKSLNDKTWINMEDGSFNFADALKLVDGKLVFSHTNGSEGITIDKGGLKVTTSKYYTPNGENIHGTGIEPDITVEIPQDILDQDYDRSIDPQFQKALEVIKEKN